MSEATVTRLETVKTDAEKAREFRHTFAELMIPVCKLMTEARRDGIVISFNVATDAMGNSFLAGLATTKELKD